MDNFQRIVSAAQGYSELGMFEEALAELDLLDHVSQLRPEILEMRVLVLMRIKKWRDALELSRQLCWAAPESGAGYVHSAFCLHELGRTAEARTMLLAGESALKNEPVFFYNLACYECALGDLTAAREYLSRSIAMDEKYREFAETDPDLAVLRGSTTAD